jgi:hypothetical protein
MKSFFKYIFKAYWYWEFVVLEDFLKWVQIIEKYDIKLFEFFYAKYFIRRIVRDV